MKHNMTEAEKELCNVMLKSKFEKAVFVVIDVLCGKKDEHANAMAEFIHKYPNEEFDVYLDKAYEIIGEPRPEIIIEGD